MVKRPRLDIVLGGAFLIFAAAGVTADYANFQHFRLGPLYALDLLYALWAVAMVAGGSWRLLGAPGRVPRWLGPVIAVFLWGILRLALDVGTPAFHAAGLARVLQHCVIFVYPLLWTLAGYWLGAAAPGFDRIVSAALLLATGLFLGVGLLPESNLSLGPVTALGLLYFLDGLLNRKPLPLSRPKAWLAAAVLAFVTFFSFWLSWYQQIPWQRIALLHLAVMILAAPLLLNLNRPARALKPMLVAVAVFAAGLGVATLAQGKPVVSSFYNVMQHGDDRTFQSGGPDVIERRTHEQLFSFRDRRYWWSRAVAQWHESPWIGIGFVPEVPDRLRDNVPNDGIFANAGDYEQMLTKGKPVSGPHNSFLSVLARMGVIGLVAYLVLLAQLAWAGARLVRAGDFDFWRLFLLLVPLNGLLHALVQVGLEAPRASILIWLYCGLALQLAYSKGWERSRGAMTSG